MAKFYVDMVGHGKFKFPKVFPIYGKIPKGTKVFNNKSEADEYAKEQMEGK